MKISRLLLWLLLLSVLLDLAVGGRDKGYVISQGQLALVAIVALAASIDDLEDAPVRISRGRGIKPRKRVRRNVRSIFKEQGPYYVRRAYRMTEKAFWELHFMLKPLIVSTYTPKPGSYEKTHRNGGRNGLISTETRLSAALRYFAGGSPTDIAICHGISHSEVFVSVWRVVDAVNNCEELAFSFPECHQKQKELALGFKNRSEAGFDCCVAAIDGLLLWIEKPSANEAWVTSGHADIYTAAYNAPGQPRNRKIVNRLTGDWTQRICLPRALRGQCYNNCTGCHGVLTTAEVHAVAKASTPHLAAL